MTSIGMRRDAGVVHQGETRDIVQLAMLACGVVSSLLYAAIDLSAGLQYKGYSFFSQTISELGAIGAPKPPWLVPLFLTYCVLMVAFGVAVLQEGRRSYDPRLKLVGALLLAYMIVGSGTSLFPMHVRGTATVADDMPHILAGLAATVTILLTMAFGSISLGRRFRNFSFTTFATIVVFGALTAPFGVKLARGEPTPGMGLLERLAYYSILVWVAGLSVALLRRAGAKEAIIQR